MIKDTIFSRRSIRKYDQSKIVDKETLEEILKYSSMGPSYGNAHPISFIVVEDSEKRKKLSEIEMFGTSYIKDVPQLIVIIADTEISKTWVEEGSIAASYLQLQAQEMGLNTSWISLKEGTTQAGQDYQEFVRELFELPKKYSALCIIPIGYGNEKVRKRQDFDIAEKIHYDKF